MVVRSDAVAENDGEWRSIVNRGLATLQVLKIMDVGDDVPVRESKNWSMMTVQGWHRQRHQRTVAYCASQCPLLTGRRDTVLCPELTAVSGRMCVVAKASLRLPMML